MSATGRRLLELGAGALLGGGVGSLTLNKQDAPSEWARNIGTGALIGMTGSAGISKVLRNRRAQKIMRDMPKDFAVPEVRQYYKDLTSPTKLSPYKTRRMISNVPSHPSWGGASGSDLVSYVDDVELNARRFGRAKAFQAAYGDVKQQLIDTGMRSDHAARAAAKAIFDRKGSPVALDMANTALQGSGFRRRQADHAKRFLDGVVDPQEINIHIQQFSNKIPNMPPLVPNHKHLDNPAAYKDIKSVLEAMRDPRYRKQHQGELGSQAIDDLVKRQTLWGFGNVKPLTV